MKNLSYRRQLTLFVALFTLFIVIIELFYFNRTSSLTEEREKTYNEAFLGEMRDRLDQMTLGVIRSAANIAYSPSVRDYVRAAPPLSGAETAAAGFAPDSEYMIRKLMIRDSIYDIIKTGEVSSVYMSGIMFVEPDGSVDFVTERERLIYEQLVREYNLLNTKVGTFTPVINPSGDAYCCYIRPVTVPLDDTDYSPSMFIIIIRMQQLRRVIGVTAASEQSVTYLVDNTGRAVLANAAMPRHAQDDIDFVIKQGVKSGDTVSLQSGRSIVYHYENRLSGMRVVTVIPENESTEKLRGIQRFALLLGLFSLGIFIMLGLLFAQSMSKPISRLVGNLRMIGENADHNMQIPVESSNEIGVIVGEINDMLAQRQLLTSNIMEMNSRMYELELEQKEARLIALQSQINPHFLYNTLECIRGIALVRDVPEIVKVAEGMSSIFRASASDAQTSTVREELALAGGYADIMSIRFSGRIRFTTEADETVLDQIIVKMILQPLVENAIYHGLEHVEEGGLVETRVLGEPDRILIEVRDNGSGIPGETIREMNECFRTGKPYTDPASGKTGLGLSNINKRLILHYGEGYGLTVGGAPGEGTVIRAELAYLQFNEIERGS